MQWAGLEPGGAQPAGEVYRGGDRGVRHPAPHITKKVKIVAQKDQKVDLAYRFVPRRIFLDLSSSMAHFL